MPQEQLRQARHEQARQQAEPGDELPLAPHLAEVVFLFNALRTQWRVVAVQGGLIYMGLDYGAMWATLERLGARPARHAVLLRYLQVMETEALLLLNAR